LGGETSELGAFQFQHIDWAELPAACRERVKERELKVGAKGEFFIQLILAVGVPGL